MEEGLSSPVEAGEHEKLINNIRERAGRENEKLSKTLLASSVAALATFGFGYNMGFPSPVEDALINGNFLSKEEFSWFNALICIGAIIGSFIASYTLDRFGRKNTILSTTFFFTIGWCLIAAAQNPAMFFIGRVICGAGTGVSSLCVSVYISEIASPKYRGGLCSLQQFSVTVGVFAGFLVGSEVNWRWSAVFPIIITVIMTIGMFFMPESPRFDLAKGRRQTALKNLQWLRGPDYPASSEVEEILNNMSQQDDNQKMSLMEFKRPALYKPLIIGVMAMVFQQFCGINAVIGYCNEIFKSASVKNVSLVTIITSLTQIVFTMVAVLIVDKCGRRILLMIGGFFMFVVMFILGVYYDITKFEPPVEGQIDIFHHRTVPVGDISWLAVTCVIIFMIMFSIGWGPIPWMLMAELFPPKARDVAGAVCNVVNWSSAFLVVKFFPQMKEALKAQGVFWFYAGFSLLSFLFTLFFVPETKGKTLEEIEKHFQQKKK